MVPMRPPSLGTSVYRECGPKEKEKKKKLIVKLKFLEKQTSRTEWNGHLISDKGGTAYSEGRTVLSASGALPVGWNRWEK